MINLAFLKKELNPPQLEAATQIDGPVLILAGAGSGKTKTITYRMAYMIEEKKIPAKSILGITFTNKAASEMRQRLQKLIPRSQNQGPMLCTFHALGVAILREDSHHLGISRNFIIYDTSDQLALIREALQSYRGGKSFDRKTIISKISWLKNHQITPSEFPNSSYFDEQDPYDLATLHCYDEYQEKLRFFNAIDFDDILFLTLNLFDHHPLIAEKYSQRFRYIMIDEYQDTNSLQFKLITHLTKLHDNLCVVGDDDQSIYGFRGANVENILQFDQNFKQAKVIKLEQNYRSTQPILTLANKIIGQNPKRKVKNLWSTKQSTDLPLLWATADTDHEAQIVVDDICKYQSLGKPLTNVAVLFRSNTQVPPFEDQLRISQIPYRIVGGQKFYDKKEIKDLIAYLCVIQNSSDTMNLRRILNVPSRGIGNVTLDHFLKLSLSTKTSLFSCLERSPQVDSQKISQNIQSFTQLIRTAQNNFKSSSLSSAIELLIEQINYRDYIQKSYPNPKQAARRKNDLENFIESAKRFEKFFSNSKLQQFLEKLLLQDSQDNQNDQENGNENTPANEVTLMTLHSSKGLEFDQVYLVGMEEELLPHKKTTTQGEDISEECRLCYVGVTRAKEKLIMTYAKERTIYGKKLERHPSRFVFNLPQDMLLRQDRTNFGHMNEVEIKEYKKSFFSGLISSLSDS